MPLQIIRQDITKMKVDAIVNTTNKDMIGYSGVDLAVHQTAGSELDIECMKIAPLSLGCAKITKGYNLDAKYIIHTSGPIWQGGLVGESIILKSCYTESLKLAVANGCESVAFPLISSGNYGYPKDQVLKYAVQIITEFLFEHELMVYLCVFDRTSYEFSQKLFAEIQEFIDDDYAKKQDPFSALKELTLRIDSISNDQPKEHATIKDARDCYDICSSSSFKSRRLSSSKPKVIVKQTKCCHSEKSLQEFLKEMDKPFADKLFTWIDKREMTDVECYKKANVDKKTFSKIKCKENYKPSKQTAAAFAVALKLNLEETQDLLASAGLTLSYSFVFDKIVMYFIQNEIYDVFTINEALFEFDQMLLGSVPKSLDERP